MFGTFTEPELVPYHGMGPLPWRSLLVLAPHPDDEVFGCGGLLAAAATQGLRSRVLVLTDGAAGGNAERREQESQRAATELGYGTDPQALQFLRHPDRELQPDAALVAELLQHARAVDADLVLAPSPFEIHPDHRATCVAAVKLATELNCPVLFYEVGQALMPNRLLDISALLSRKQAAMACFESQLREQAYAEQVLALNRYRAYTLGPHVNHAEAFWLLGPEQLQQSVAGVVDRVRANLVERLQPQEVSAATFELPDGAPLRQGGSQCARVSVLVRSMDRDSLQACLASLVAQPSELLHEVVVVNASGRSHRPLTALNLSGTLPLRLIEPGRALDRAAAANCALEQAQGELLLLLDDDDQVDAHHLARLHAALLTSPQAVAAYSGVRLVDAEGLPQGELDEPFDRLRLWCANYLPIHAVMFRRAALGADLRFDERLAVYEDWSFWLRLAARGEFVHVPGCSATYCLAGASGLGRDAAPEFVVQARARVYEGLRDAMDAQTLQALLARTDSLRVQHREALLQLHTARRGAQSLELRLADQAQALASCEQELLSARQQAQADRLRAQEDRERAQQQMEEAQHYQHHLLHELELQRQTYQGLEQAYQAQQASLSWRITAPLRAVRGLASPQGLRRLARSLPLPPAHKQQVKVWLSTKPWGRALLRRLTPGASHEQPAEPPLDKEAVRADAESQLQAFLACGERLRFKQVSSATPTVSVVVVLFNQAGLSFLCLQALAAVRDVDFELLIVDNASSDRMPELLERLDGVTLLPQQENLGFLRAVNLAAAQARGEFLLLLNNDALVEPQTLSQAVRRLRQDAAAAAVGGPILLWDGRLQEAGSIVWQDGSCLGYGRGDSPDAGPYRFVRDVDYCSGAFLMLRRDVFESLGRFDDRYAPAYYEESDLCFRLIEQGKRVVYDPAVRVRHFEFASDAGSGRALELQARNRQVFAQAHARLLQGQQPARLERLLWARQRLPAAARRILFIDDRVPLPWLGQGYPRANAFVHALVEAGHFVTHYPLQFPHESWDDVARCMPERVEVMLGLGLAGLHGFFAERQGYYDTLIVSRPHNMQVLRALRRQHPDSFADLRVVYDAEALFSLRDIAKARLLGREPNASEAQRLVREELGLAEGADAVVAVSAMEAEHYRQGGFGEVHVLGHALEPKAGEAGFEARRGFLFVGAIQSDDSPNGDSLIWFIREVWPRIQAALGDSARLDIVGSCESETVRQLAGAHIHVHGKVDALAPHFASARVFIVPTRFAAGMPHKAHEAAAAGLPMVTTPLIAEQLGWSDSLLQGQDATAFATACLSLHGDPEQWQMIRARALEAVRRDCSPAAFKSCVAKIAQGAAV